MRTTRGVETLVGKNQALDRLSVDDVGLDDLLDVCGSDAPVPDAIGINHHGWSVLALVEASGHIGPHPFLEASQSQLLFEEELQLGLARGIAAAARMSGFTRVAANEKVLLELGHEINVQDSTLDIAQGRRTRLSACARRCDGSNHRHGQRHVQ